MVFPVAELKFSSIARTTTRTRLLVRLYRVDDGGLDGDGHQVYLRTLKRERPVDLPPNITKVEVLAQARLRIQAWALDEGFNLPDDRLICAL